MDTIAALCCNATEFSWSWSLSFSLSPLNGTLWREKQKSVQNQDHETFLIDQWHTKYVARDYGASVLTP